MVIHHFHVQFGFYQNSCFKKINFIHFPILSYVLHAVVKFRIDTKMTFFYKATQRSLQPSLLSSGSI